jgi:hypothetical protein
MAYNTLYMVCVLPKNGKRGVSYIFGFTKRAMYLQKSEAAARNCRLKTYCIAVGFFTKL